MNFALKKWSNLHIYFMSFALKISSDINISVNLELVVWYNNNQLTIFY